MNIITLDFETFFSDDYSLSKMTTESYIRDPRFETHGAAIRWGHTSLLRTEGETQWFPHWELKKQFATVDWWNTAVLCHHAQFDGLILSHHYGVKPHAWLDTLGMARLLLGNHLSVGLDSLARHWGLAGKSVPYNLFRGKHWNELDPIVQKQVADGCVHDTTLTWEIFNILAKDFPAEEYQVIDTTVRMFTEPVLRADLPLLAKIWRDENTNKKDRLAALNVSEADLQSAERFAQLLRDEGVEPDTKDGKNGPIYAFAKTDEFMRNLLEDENDRVRMLAEARLGVKSTIMQTRAETLGWMARRGLGGSSSALPVYLRYCGAHTTRWSGGDGCLTANTQVLTLDIHGTPQYKRLIDVMITDLVWDGIEFVEHDGVKFAGYKKVISWDGIHGTPEHQVFCGEKSKSLSAALRTKTPIMDCREPTAWEVETGRARQRSRT